KTHRALSEFRIAGAPTNVGFLQALLAHPAVAAGDVHTRFIEEHMAELAGTQAAPRLYFEAAAPSEPPQPKRAGYQVDAGDPLAVLVLGKESVETADEGEEALIGP